MDDHKILLATWFVLTALAACGWVALGLIVRAAVASTLKKHFPSAYRAAWFLGLAVIGLVIEISSSEIAAYFFSPTITETANLQIRTAGRLVEALTVWVAFVACIAVRANGREH